MQNDEKKHVPVNMPTLEDIMKNANDPNQQPSQKEFISQMVEKISQKADEDFSSEMPSFDLGNQILAQQRKIAALKRKSPSQIPVENTKQSVSAKPKPQIFAQPPASPQQRIIADIIAREIKQLTVASR